jgi:hypothetical protein
MRQGRKEIMKRNMKNKSPKRFRSIAILALAIGLLFFLGSFSSTLLNGLPNISPEALSKDTNPSLTTYSSPSSRLFQNISEGEADIGAIVIDEEGSLSTTFLSAGDGVGQFDTSSPEYEYCLMALAMFRWGDYDSLTENLLAFLGGESEGEITSFLEFIDILPLSSILMVFYGGQPEEMQAWGSLIAEDFSDTLDMPFSRITGIPPLTIEEMEFGVEAYGYDGTDIDARNDFQEYMANLGSTRRGVSELVTPEVAETSNGSIGVCGIFNMGAISEEPGVRAPLQTNETLIFTSWLSLHKDMFYGREEQFFDVNDFCDRTGTISMNDLDALDFTILLPADVNVTDYYPDDMTNSTSSENVEVSRPTSIWQAVPTVPTINITFHGPFPPGLSFTKTITPNISPGATATVTIIVKNIDPSQTVFNISVDDLGSWDLYAAIGTDLITITGETTAEWASLAPGESESFVYYVAIKTEGIYFSDRANVTYQDNTTETFEKQSNKVSVVVFYTSIIDFLLTLFNDMPWSIPVILIVGLMLLYLAIAFIKSLRRKKRPTLGPAPTFAKAPPEPSPPKQAPFPEPDTGAPTSEICINCGALVPPGVMYCPACGARVSSEP